MSAKMAQKIRVGEFVQDGNAEAQITDISPSGQRVIIEYTDTHETTELQRNRFERADCGLRVV